MTLNNIQSNEVHERLKHYVRLAQEITERIHSESDTIDQSNDDAVP